MLEFLKVDWQTLVIFISLLIGAFGLSEFCRWIITKSFNSASVKLNVDPTRYKFFKNALSFIIWLVAIGTAVSLMPKLRALAIALFAGAGILVAILGFAAQQAFSNIISGVFIVIFRPFRVGDMIKVGSLQYGIVDDITLRHTVITNFENKKIIIPNSVIGSEVIVNDSIDDVRIVRWVEVGISYDSDIDLAIQIIQEEAIKHPFCIDIRTETQKQSNIPQVEVRLMSFGDFSINLRAYVWSGDSHSAIRMHSDINKAIKKRFDLEGVEIPFPYRTIVYKKDLPENAKIKNNE